MSQPTTETMKVPVNKVRTYTNEQYVAAVGMILGIAPEDITRKYRHAPPHIMDAQNILCFLLRQREKVGLYEMRDLLNKENHGSISLQISQYNFRSVNVREFRSKANRVLEEIDTILQQLTHGTDEN